MQELAYLLGFNATLITNVEKTKNVVVGNAFVCLHSLQTIEMETDVKVLVIDLDVVSTLNALPLTHHNACVKQGIRETL
jgi:hypothetical protein